MQIPLAIFQVLASLLIPVGILWAEPRSRFVRTVSPVILCYGIGMLFGFIRKRRRMISKA